VGFVYISYAGVTKVAAIAEEIKNPSRNLPLSILVSLGIAMLFYGFVVLSMVGLMDFDQASPDLVPIYSLGEAVGGAAIGVVAAILAILTLTSMANAGLLAASRFPFAMSRDSLLPGVFKTVHPRFLTPINCIIATAATMAFVIVFLDLEKIVKLASACKLLAFVGVNSCVIVFRESSTPWYRPPFRSPLYPWMQIAGIIIGLVLLGVLGWISVLAVVALVPPGMLLYASYGRKRTERAPVWQKLGRRKELLTTGSFRPDAEEEHEQPAEEVMVPIFGHERSPETLIEVAAALAHGEPMEVLHLTEIPEQTLLGAMLEDDVVEEGLRRRVTEMSKNEGINIDFQAIVSRDVLKTVAETTARAGCRWLVTEWPDRSRRNFTRFNPLGWLIHHLPCNLALFKNAGIRDIRKVLIHAEPGPDDALVCRTADQMARRTGATITFGCYVETGADEEELEARVSYYEQLRGFCTVPTDVEVIRGRNEVEAFAAASSDYDLMVMGGAKEHGFSHWNFGLRRDQLAARSACSVLTLRTPREETHAALDHSPADETPSLMDLLDEHCVAANIKAKTKTELFAHFATSFSRATDCSAQEIEAALWERERTQNTAIGDGLAIPHASLTTTNRSTVGVFTVEEPIEYGAPDGVGTDVYFVITSPPSDRRVHLMLLSSVARLMQQTELLSRLREAKSTEELMEALRRGDHEAGSAS